MGRKHWLLGMLAMSSILLAGCAAAQSAPRPAADEPQMSGNMVMPPGMSMAPGMTMANTTPTPSSSDSVSADHPSASAQLVCSSEIRTDVATILALHPAPATTTTWSDHLYTCTYQLPAGPLVLSVKESADVPTAQNYLTALQQRLAPTQPLTGLDGLGNSGYDTTGGIVIVRKDDKTLEVDASHLPPTVRNQSRSDLAYEVATDVLGCWSGQ